MTSWLSATRSPAVLAPRVRTALHQAALLGMPWCDQLAVAQNQHWQRVGVLRKTVWKYGAATVAQSLRAHQLTASSLSWAGGFTGSAGFTFNEAVADGQLAIQDAAEIGAEALVVAPGDRHGHTFRHARRLVIDGLRFLVDVAAERRVSLALLAAAPACCARWSHIAPDEYALELLQEVGSPWLGLACALPCGDPSAVAPERWQQVVQQTRVFWTNAEQFSPTVSFRAGGLGDALKRLSRGNFTGVWELRAQATRASGAAVDRRDCCRAVSEALGLSGSARPEGVRI